MALDEVAVQSKQLASARTEAGRPTDAIQWHAANRLFGQQGYAFRDSFLTLMHDDFAAPLELLDFRGNTERARSTINVWVEEQTRDKIRDLIPAGGLTEDTRLVLVNALYLNAPWDNPFEKSSTSPQPFHFAPGASHDVPTMRQIGPMGHTVENGNTIVTLDYLGGGLQFVIILPDEGVTTEAAAARLTSADFARWARLRDSSRKHLALYLPKFRAEGATLPLSSVLKAMGMKSAFDVPRGSANFDRIAPRLPDEYLAISDVFHQTFMAVDEQGTEAAAATAVVIGVTALLPAEVEVRVDRPFLFAIQHRASGACLFLGRIADPR
jgi:serpin B